MNDILVSSPPQYSEGEVVYIGQVNLSSLAEEIGEPFILFPNSIPDKCITYKEVVIVKVIENYSPTGYPHHYYDVKRLDGSTWCGKAVWRTLDSFKRKIVAKYTEDNEMHPYKEPGVVLKDREKKKEFQLRDWACENQDLCSFVTVLMLLLPVATFIGAIVQFIFYNLNGYTARATLVSLLFIIAWFFLTFKRCYPQKRRNG